MVSVWTVLVFALTIAAAMVYSFVGMRLGRRDVAGDGALAWRLFTHWWIGLAASSLVSAFSAFLPSVGFHHAPFYLTASYVNTLIVVYALWALLFYLLYLFTGRRRLIVPVSIFYIGVYLALTYWVNAQQPVYDAALGAIRYTRPIGGAVLAAIYGMILLPQLVGAIAYFTLFFKVDDPTQRYRIGLIATTIFIWFASALLGAIPLSGLALSSAAWWPAFSRLIGLVAAVTIFAAYQPPRWVRERYGIAAVMDRPRS